MAWSILTTPLDLVIYFLQYSGFFRFGNFTLPSTKGAFMRFSDSKHRCMANMVAAFSFITVRTITHTISSYNELRICSTHLFCYSPGRFTLLFVQSIFELRFHRFDLQLSWFPNTCFQML